MKTKKQSPTPEEVALAARDRQAENLQVLRDGVALAREAFATDRPTFEMAVGCAQVVESGVDRDLVAPLLAEARDLAGRYGDGSVETALVLFDALLADEACAAHLAEAAAEAARLFPDAWKDVVVDVYFQVYGWDEDDAEIEAL